MSAVRIRGRKGQALRRRRLAMHPICAECAKRELVIATEFIDHVKAIALGGLDVDENCQGLCAVCHAIKTALESPSAEAASNHPDWLRPAIGPLRIVCGPPCSGRAAYVARHAAVDDLVIDTAGILERMLPDFQPWRTPIDDGVMSRAIRVRNAMLGSLSTQPGRSAWLLLGAPTAAERAWWVARLGGLLIVMDSPRLECESIAAERGGPVAARAVARWYASVQQPWSPPKKKLAKVAFGVDGYPLEVS